MRNQILVWIVCLLASGCGLTGNRLAMHDVVGQRDFRSASLEYSIDAGKLGVPMAVSRIGAQQVSYEEVPSAPLSKRSMGTLQITYPHPAQREGMALVGVVVQQRRPPERGMMPRLSSVWRGISGNDETFVRTRDNHAHEAWVLDISKQELDRILTAVAQQQQLDSAAAKGPAGVRLTASVDGQHWKLAKQSHPELDALMQRVRGSGQLISFHGAAQPADTRWKAPASLVALEQHQHDIASTTALFAGPDTPATETIQAASRLPVQPAIPVARLPQAGRRMR